MTSDQGWSADHGLHERPLESPPHRGQLGTLCIDGTAAPGEQTFTFWKGYPEAFPLKGWDRRSVPSGACGWNKQLDVQLPFTLTPVG